MGAKGSIQLDFRLACNAYKKEKNRMICINRDTDLGQRWEPRSAQRQQEKKGAVQEKGNKKIGKRNKFLGALCSLSQEHNGGGSPGQIIFVKTEIFTLLPYAEALAKFICQNAWSSDNTTVTRSSVNEQEINERMQRACCKGRILTMWLICLTLVIPSWGITPGSM